MTYWYAIFSKGEKGIIKITPTLFLRENWKKKTSSYKTVKRVLNICKWGWQSQERAF